MIMIWSVLFQYVHCLNLQKEPDTVPQVDLAKFMGVWHEQAHSVNPYELKCMNSMANFNMEPHYIKVNFSCHNVDSGKL